MQNNKQTKRLIAQTRNHIDQLRKANLDNVVIVKANDDSMFCSMTGNLDFIMQGVASIVCNAVATEEPQERSEALMRFLRHLNNESTELMGINLMMF